MMRPVTALEDPPRAPVTTSGVPPATASTRGADAHRQGVERLLESYRAVPPGRTVRLAKGTSAVLRPRAGRTGPGLDVSGLTGVVSIDTGAPGRPPTAEVQGMCTYEELVAATLPEGLVPLVVPQLRTTTLGGAVTGPGLASSSFRNGLPHESVLELDVLTGAGEIVPARPDGEHADLHRGFPGSCGTLGYAVRLRIELERAAPCVALRNVRFGSPEELAAAVAEVSGRRSWEGEPVDFVDGMVLSTDEAYLTLGTWADDAPALSDYTGREVYYRSLRYRGRDALTTHDYLWRWDTDWFWCSAAFGAQHPLLRRLWPASRRRSDVYHRLLGLENRYAVAARLDRLRGRPAHERVVQDVVVHVGLAAGLLRWWAEHVPMSPLWICPLRLREPGPAAGDDGRPWPLYPLRRGQTYVTIGFRGTVPIAPGRRDGDVNRAVQDAVRRFDGHTSPYSDADDGREEFRARHGGEVHDDLKSRYDPQGRLLDLFDKAVRRR